MRFGVLNAGNYGVPQSRKRTFIWAAAPEEQLPAWPQHKYVFRSPQLTINLPGGVTYTAVPQTQVSTGDGVETRGDWGWQVVRHLRVTDAMTCADDNPPLCQRVWH